MKRYIKQEGIPVLSVILVSVFPVIFLYFRNAEEAGFSEIAPILFASIGFGVVLYLICNFVVRSAVKSAIAASLLVAIFTNFSLLEKGLKAILPTMKYWHTVPIIFVIGLHIVYAMWHFLPDDILEDIVKVICAVFSVLIFVNGAMGTPKIVRRLQAQQQLQHAAESSQSMEREEYGKPNIYLFLFDEYANFPQIEQQYLYDNEPLKTFLEENNFSVSYTSRNEANKTRVVVTNLVNLEYLVDNTDDISTVNTLRKSGALFTLMREMGYNVQICDYTGFLTNDSPLEGNAVATSAKTVGGDTLIDLLIQKTVMYPFYETSTTDSLYNITKLVNYVSDPKFIPDGDTFTMVYLCFPHEPFIVDENGDQQAISSVHQNDWDDPQYYLGQYKYATKIMIQMLQNILEHDSNSLIFVQSDHGARGKGCAEYLWEFITNPLNAVYYQGNVDVNIEGLSTVNTLRYVLNRFIGTDFEMLEVPNYERWKSLA